jgi:hypothetical protein
VRGREGASGAGAGRGVEACGRVGEVRRGRRVSSWRGWNGAGVPAAGDGRQRAVVRARWLARGRARAAAGLWRACA